MMMHPSLSIVRPLEPTDLPLALPLKTGLIKSLRPVSSDHTFDALSRTSLKNNWLVAWLQTGPSKKTNPSASFSILVFEAMSASHRGSILVIRLVNWFPFLGGAASCVSQAAIIEVKVIIVRTFLIKAIYFDSRL